MKKQNIRNVLAMFLVLSLVALSFAGCGGNDTTSSAAPAETPSSEAPAENPGTEAPAAETDYPTKDITVVVPWNPGGGTDLTVRALTEEMSNVIGKRMPVTNMPGASGSVGMQDVYDSESDGYKILGHGMMAFTNAQVMGFSDISYKDWNVWNAAFSPNVIAVRKDSPYQTIEDLIAAMTANPGSITCSSAGVGSGGHIGATVFAEGVGATYEHITYDGGNPAIIAAMGGEVDFTAQLSMEMIDMLRSGDMIGLACLSDVDMVIEGVDGEIVIPSIKAVAPGLADTLPVGESFGIMVPNDTPAEIVDVIDNAYKAAVASDAFQALADEKGIIVLGLDVPGSAEYLDKLASVVCWTLYDTGSASISPDSVGIPRL